MFAQKYHTLCPHRQDFRIARPCPSTCTCRTLFRGHSHAIARGLCCILPQGGAFKPISDILAGHNQHSSMQDCDEMCKIFWSGLHCQADNFGSLPDQPTCMCCHLTVPMCVLNTSIPSEWSLARRITDHQWERRGSDIIA